MPALGSSVQVHARPGWYPENRCTEKGLFAFYFIIYGVFYFTSTLLTPERFTRGQNSARSVPRPGDSGGPQSVTVSIGVVPLSCSAPSSRRSSPRTARPDRIQIEFHCCGTRLCFCIMRHNAPEPSAPQPPSTLLLLRITPLSSALAASSGFFGPTQSAVLFRSLLKIFCHFAPLLFL